MDLHFTPLHAGETVKGETVFHAVQASLISQLPQFGLYPGLQQALRTQLLLSLRLSTRCSDCIVKALTQMAPSIVPDHPVPDLAPGFGASQRPAKPIQGTLTAPFPNPSLQVTADHQLKQVEAPVLAPSRGEVLLHIKATGVCGWALRLRHLCHSAKRPLDQTSISGKQAGLVRLS